MADASSQQDEAGYIRRAEFESSTLMPPYSRIVVAGLGEEEAVLFHDVD